MYIPTKFKLYRAACLVNLLLLTLILLFSVWMVTLGGTRFWLNFGFISATLFCFINFINDRAGLKLFKQLQLKQSINEKQQIRLWIYWGLQLLLNAFIIYQLYFEIQRYAKLLGWMPSPFKQTFYPRLLIADILVTLSFITATYGLIMLWPLVRYIKQQFHTHQEKDSLNKEHMLTRFE